VIIDEKAELFLWDRDEGYFVREASVSTKIVQRKGAKFLFFLTATSQEEQVLAHRITSQMMQRWSPATWSLTWNNVNESGNQSSWCLRFESQESFEDFRAEFTKRAWENLNETSWDKVKVCDEKTWREARAKFMQADERAYVLSSGVEDVEMAVETDDDEEDAVLDELGGEYLACSRKFYYTNTVPQTRMKTKMMQQREAVHPLAPKMGEILNSPLGTKAIDRTLYEAIRLASSGSSPTTLNTLLQSAISQT
jgi:hypothetical protein